MVVPTAAFAPDSSHALQSCWLPGRGGPHDEAGVGVDDDLLVGGVPVVLRLLGDNGPSTISTVFFANRLRGWRLGVDPRPSMIGSAPDLETPNNGTSWRLVGFVCQYVATGKVRSFESRLHGQVLWTAGRNGRPNQRGSPLRG